MFSKHLHLCFFKLKHPTILSQHHDNSSPSPPSTPNSTLFPFKTTFTHDYCSSSSDSDSISELPPPDFASVFASQRFFFSSPGNSNSIIESSDDTRHYISHNNNNMLIPKGGVRVPKYSINPYVDFLRSMQEMIDSRPVLDVRKDWDYLHELLLCYLALNPTHTHKYIVRAFTDLVVDLLSSSSSSSLLSSSSSSSSSPPPPAVETTPCRHRKYKYRRQCSSFSGPLV